jgi:PAS domain S-box-containing protein
MRGNRSLESLKNNWTSPGIQKRFPPGLIVLITIIGIALAEVLAMIVIYYLDDLSYPIQVILDATIMIIIIYPWLHYLVFKPLNTSIHHRIQSEKILQARLLMIQSAATHSLDELLQFVLDEIQLLTGSSIGFFHFLEDDQRTIKLQTWSTSTLEYMCAVDVKSKQYDIEKAGIWADAVRTKQTIIHNDYSALPHQKALPPGHAKVIRELVTPITRNNSVKAILGVGNKPSNYTNADKDMVTSLADFAWDVIQQKLADIALHKSEEKFRTLVDWTYDWEMWLTPASEIVYISPSCERITGYTPDNFIASPDLLISIIHPDDRGLYITHQNLLHDPSSVSSTIEYRIMTRVGNIRWIEHACNPLFDADGNYLGRRISNRDITYRKRIEIKLAEQIKKEELLTQTLQSLQSEIARDLHDTLGQQISYIRMNLEHLSSSSWQDQERICILLENLTRVADESYELIRSELSMLNSGLLTDPTSLFTRYAMQVSNRASFQVHISSHGKVNLSPSQLRQIFFIYREAITNIEKYARASDVTVELKSDDKGFSMTITDNGLGFDPLDVPTTDHFGLRSMQERIELLHGTINIQSSKGAGTLIALVVPYENSSEVVPQ